MTRSRHPKKEVEAAVQYAERCGWTCVNTKGHAWGKILCPWNDTECRCGEYCIKSVWSTPRVPENLAAQIRRAVDGCVYLQEQGSIAAESGEQSGKTGGEHE